MGLTLRRSPSWREFEFAKMFSLGNEEFCRSASGGVMLSEGAVVSWFYRTHHFVTLIALRLNVSLVGRDTLRRRCYFFVNVWDKMKDD